MFAKRFLSKRLVVLVLFVLLGLITPISVRAVSTPGGLGTGDWGLVTGRGQGGQGGQRGQGGQGSSASSQSLIVKGRSLYEAGQFAEAADVWKQAADAFAASGDKLRQALALSNLSLTCQQLGQWDRAQDAIAQSLTLLNNLEPKTKDSTLVLAQTLNIQGRLLLSLGQTEKALDTWKQAATTYKQAGNEVGAIRSSINQAQALQVLGFYNQALKTLTHVYTTLNTQPDSIIKSAGLRSLGNALRVAGNIEKSQEIDGVTIPAAKEIVQQSLDIAQRLRSPQDTAESLFSLGNIARTQANTQAALTYYEQAENTATSPDTKLQARLNRFSLLLEDKQWQKASELLPPIQNDLSKLPPSRTSVYARINLAQSLMKPGSNRESVLSTDIAQILAQAIQDAKSLQDPRAQSYALGNLGELYEQTQQFNNAQNLTQQALVLAQAMNAGDITYRWQWQLGRLLKAQGDNKSAIAAYTEAFNTLKTLRKDLVAVNPEVQFSFRDSVEPVYRQFVDLLLEKTSAEQKEISQDNLEQARKVIEALQLAELDNFFRDACVTAKEVQIDQVDRKAAVLYPIILKDRIEIILSLSGQPLRHYTTDVPQKQVETTLRQLRLLLQSASEDPDLLLDAQQVYNWLIRPAETELKNSGIKTLVFVLDGALRNIPMAVLHDGNQYLVEQYSLALTPGLQLLPTHTLQRTRLTALAAGLTEARSEFPALPNVEKELRIIQSEVPSSEELLNQTFTSTAIQTQIKASPFPVVHIATHGKFSADAENTFILTWDRPVNVKELDTVLRTGELSRREPLELLVLSACETAAGDNRAALGLAGVAVKAGARSTMATLWQVSDESTALLIGQFYKELADTNVTKAEALRRAQLLILKNPDYQYPYYWAPFVLVGNWL